MDEFNIIRFAEIISRYLRGEGLSQKEQQEVDYWRNSSLRNRELWNKISRRTFLEEKFIAEKLYNSQKDYEKFLKRKEKYVRRRKFRYAISGVAAAILFLLGGAVLWKTSTEQQYQKTTTYSIPFGESKAILSFDDGMQIILGEERHDTLRKDGQIIVMFQDEAFVYNEDTNDARAGGFNVFRVPRRGEFRVQLPDGTKVWLNSESQIRYPVDFGEKERWVSIDGEAYFEVVHDAERPFRVEISGGVVEVLGTSFNVKSYSGDNLSSTTLVEGKVKILSENAELTLLPKEQGVIDMTTGAIEKHKADLRVVLAWKEGRFIFKEERLEEIMQTLARWYDISVVFENERVKGTEFTGNLPRYENFNQILEMLEMTGTARFRIDNETIYIYEK